MLPLKSSKVWTFIAPLEYFPRAQVIKLVTMRFQADTNIPKRVARSKLTEKKLHKLIPAV